MEAKTFKIPFRKRSSNDSLQQILKTEPAKSSVKTHQMIIQEHPPHNKKTLEITRNHIEESIAQKMQF